MFVKEYKNIMAKLQSSTTAQRITRAKTKNTQEKKKITAKFLSSLACHVFHVANLLGKCKIVEAG